MRIIVSPWTFTVKQKSWTYANDSSCFHLYGIDSETVTWQICIMAIAYPDIRQENCLNIHLSSTCEIACTHCRDICPSHAIDLNKDSIPHLNDNLCTGCTACAHMCPSDAIIHEEIEPVGIVQQAIEFVRRGKTSLHAACSAVADTSTDLNVSCHAAWDPMLLACMAAEGIRTLHLDGINQCGSCPVRHGAEIMAQTEKDYALLNKALGICLEISREETNIPIKQTQPSVPEPDRRTFFRNLFPAMAQGTIKAATQLNQTGNDKDNEARTATSARLPLRLRLFLRALPRLQANFTPVPNMPSLPLGAIQADASCTACNKCVEQCPTHALELKEFGTNRVLEFRPDACTDCRQCVGICPEHALEALPAISLPVLLTRRTRPLVMVTSGKKYQT